ncbi:uncharacterized protein LOC107608163 [Arachis ipaensis]|uniref:Uncharacterized protein n=1 Tax=Arachis hypogaea TaxID=3818 RepID=A0A445CD72_ARAHY|nr:uncharacterized protein LOC107608163 [Arachis ipaensis]RYR48878.1 hypothetical protein Ahy_A07g034964 [Arachis hypogaea]
MHHNCPVCFEEKIVLRRHRFLLCHPLLFHALLSACVHCAVPHLVRSGSGLNLFDDSTEYILGGSRLGNKFRGLSKIQALRSSSSDKERANNVAKIKVVICFVLHVSLLCFL